MICAPNVRLTILLFAFCISAQTASADLFSGLFNSAPKPKTLVTRPAEQENAAQSGPETGARCVAEILQAEARYGIPDNLLLAIGIQEAGKNGPAGLAVWPWTVNAAGEGAFFQSRAEAQAWVRMKQAQGIRSIDVGCMQINLRWHGQHFVSQDAAFAPEKNVDYAARFLRNLYRETGSWEDAAGRYHSATEEHKTRYLGSLERNLGVVRAQLSRLTALARSFVPSSVQVAEVSTPKAPPPPVFWNADAETGATYSIYSNTPLGPVLPDYEDVN